MQLLKTCLGLSLLTFSLPSFSSGFSAALYGGYNHMSTNEDRLQLPVEKDTLYSTDGGNGFVGGIGVGYAMDQFSSFIKRITVGPEVFYFSEQRKGDVWQFQNSALANYNYSIKIKSARIMLDGWLDLNPLVWEISPLLGAGIGGANIKTSYADQLSTLGFQSGISGGNIVLGNNTNNNFVYSLSAGLRKPLTPKLLLSAFYTYTNFGTVESSTQASQVTLLQPIRFNMHTNSAMLALTYLFG